MASTASPYGLRAVNELGGLPYAGSTRSFLIDPAGYNTNIFNGSIVAINTSGYINIVTTNGDNSTPFPAGTIGVFVGCSFTNAQGQIIYSQYYPANTASVQGSAITAYVIDDDRAVFQVQANGTLAQTALGMNVILSAVQSTSTGSTTTGNSTTAVSNSAAATSGYAFRVVGFADTPGFSAVGDAFTDILVKFNPGAHSYSNATGVA
jgi:hypothetical protein